MGYLAYCTVGSNRIGEAKAFYDALLGSVGIMPVFEHPSGGRVYGHTGAPRFAVLPPHDAGYATAGNGSMFAFSFDKRVEVDKFYALAIELGGTNEGAPGLRAPDRYYAYFRDLDGNKICAFSVEPDDEHLSRAAEHG